MVNIGEGVMDITAVRSVGRSFGSIARCFPFFVHIPILASQNSGIQFLYLAFFSRWFGCCMDIIALVGRFSVVLATRGFEEVQNAEIKDGIFYSNEFLAN